MSDHGGHQGGAPAGPEAPPEWGDEGPRRSSRVQTGGPPQRRPLFAVIRVGIAGALSALVVIPASFFLLPMPEGADGVTLCLPVIGPLQQFAEDLKPDYEEVVQIHEAVHAEQCRRLGAAGYAGAYRTAPGRIELEAEAFCAEIEHLAARGDDPGRLLDRTVEALYIGYRNGGSVPRPEVQLIVEGVCTLPGEP